MMDCELKEIFANLNSHTFPSEWDGERGLQVHLRDGHQEEVDAPQQQPADAGNQGGQQDTSVPGLR